MTDEEVLKIENLALKQENARLNKVITILKSMILESVHVRAELMVKLSHDDKDGSTSSIHQT